jgi:hypothetical protein
MKKLSMADVLPGQVRDREQAEERVQAGQDGRTRRRLGKTKQIIVRVRPERHAQILRLADALNTTMADVIERGIDALDERLKGHS